MLARLDELSRMAAALPASGDADPQWWIQALVRQCHEARDDCSPSFPSDRRSITCRRAGVGPGAPTGGGRAAARIRQIEQLAQRCAEQAAMDFTFLYDSACDLLSIGYNVTDRRRDPSYYDLLASEARVASFILIAQDQLPQEHWFALGRQLTTHDGAMRWYRGAGRCSSI